MTYNILKETFCYYCQTEHETLEALQDHMTEEHPESVAKGAIERKKSRT